MTYQDQGKLDRTAWITDPRVPDPENLPEPLGWCILVRPYPVTNASKSSLKISDKEMDYVNHVTNIGRVVSVGASAYSKDDHKSFDGKQEQWVKPGDFVSFPKHAGSKRKFKGVSFIILVDDEIVERLPDPQIFDDGPYRIDIPEEDLKKYNTVYNTEK